MTGLAQPSPDPNPGLGRVVRPDPWLSLIRRKIAVGQDLLRFHGPVKFFGRILPWTLHRRYVLFEGSTAETASGPEAAASVRSSLAKPEDLPLLLSARPGFYNLGRLEERLAAGHACFIAWLGRRPVGIRWAFVGSVYLPYLSRTLVLAPDEAYSDELFVVPRFRRQGVDRRNFQFMCSWFKARGFRRHFCLLTPWDEHLHRRYERLGMRQTGEVIRLSGAGRKTYRWEGRFQDLGRGRVAIAPNGIG
jgi:GNAT superfamily N-acetyltransferase